MGQAAEPYRTALVVHADPERRSFAATLLEEAFPKVVEASSIGEALSLTEDGSRSLAFAFVDLGEPSGNRNRDLTKALASRCPRARIAAACDRPDAPLPTNAVAILRPWSALDLLLEAERAITGGRRARRAMPPAEEHRASRMTAP